MISEHKLPVINIVKTFKSVNEKLRKYTSCSRCLETATCAHRGAPTASASILTQIKSIPWIRAIARQARRPPPLASLLVFGIKSDQLIRDIQGLDPQGII